MRRKPNRLKAFIGTLILTAVGIYAVYINTFDTGNDIHTKKYRDVPIHMNVPVRYDGTITPSTMDVVVQGSKKMIRKLSNKKVTLSADYQAREGSQTEKINIRGVEGYIYKMERNTATAHIRKIKPKKMKPKVIIKGQPTQTVEGVEIKEDIHGFFKDNEKMMFDRVEIVIQGDAIKNGKPLKGQVIVRDKQGNEMNGKLVDHNEVVVIVHTKKLERK